MTEETLDVVEVAKGITVYAELLSSGERVPITRREDGYHYGNDARLVVDNSSDNSVDVSSQHFNPSRQSETHSGQIRKGTEKTFSTAHRVEIADAVFINDTPLIPAKPKNLDQRASDFLRSAADKGVGRE